MDAYYLEVRRLENKFYGLEFHHVVHDNNVAADVLSKLGEQGSPSSNYSSMKRSSRGLQRQNKPLLSSRTSYPSHQSSRLLARRSSYCSTSLRLLTWSVLPSLSSGRKTATPT
jgi:hypothetical protein